MTDEELFAYAFALEKSKVDSATTFKLQMTASIVSFIEDVQKHGEFPNREWLDRKFAENGIIVDKTITFESFREKVVNKQKRKRQTKKEDEA